MKGLKRAALLVGSLALIMPLQFGGISHSDTSPALIFSEVKIRNDSAGFDEYIEVYNPSSEPVDLNTYFINYANTPNPSVDQQFTQAVIGVGLLDVSQSLILAKNSADPNLSNAQASPFSSLSDSGGTLEITDSDGVVVDRLAWTNTQSAAVAPIVYLSGSTTTKNQSFTRTKDENGQYLLTDNSWKLASPSPLSSVLLPLPTPEPEPEPDLTQEPANNEPITDPVSTSDGQPTDSPVSDTIDQTGSTETQALPDQPIQITELLPNPASPASDSTDEFIELFNPNNQSVSLKGYKLQTGSSFNYSYTFEDTNLATQTYEAFYISVTGDILSNTTSQARLLGPTGVIVAQTNVYSDAPDGQAWAFINGAWQWTTTPTPGNINLLTLPPVKVIAAKASTAKKTTSSKSSSSKKKAAVKSATTGAAADSQTFDDPADTPAAIHPSLLVAVGTITVLYAIYEYRYDVINKLRQFRRYRTARRTARVQS